MRIVFDVSYVQMTPAGIGRYTHELLTDLLDVDAANEYILHGWAYSIDRERITRFRRENVRLSLARIPGAAKRFYWNRLRFPSLERVVGRFDVFHGAEPLLPPLDAAAGITTVHDLAYVRHPELFEKKVLRRDLAVRRSVRRSAGIVVPSLFTKSELVNIFGVEEGKIRLVRPPVLRGCSPRPDEQLDNDVRRAYGLNSPFALFVGVIEPRKNIGRIIKAFERAHAANKIDLDLVLVGKKGWLYEETLLAIDRSTVRSRIRRLHFVPDKDLMALYRLARLFVYPSLYEGYGSPLAEAMASGLPAITSRNSALQEIGGDSVILVDPHDTDELASAIVRLAGNDPLHDRLAASGLLRIREIHAQSAARTLLELYKDVGSQ